MSNRNYAVIGGLRGVAQTISYEISLSFILLGFLVLRRRPSLLAPRLSPTPSGGEVFPLLVLLWGVRVLAELNRTPFDFAEGESELVSGFNIEYGAVGFAVLFMAEYGMISLLAGLRRVLVLGYLSIPASLVLMGAII